MVRVDILKKTRCLKIQKSRNRQRFHFILSGKCECGVPAYRIERMSFDVTTEARQSYFT